MANGAAIPYHFAMTHSNPAEPPAPFAALRWLFEAGADEAIGESPVNRFRPSAPATASRQQTERTSVRPPVPRVQTVVPSAPAQSNDRIGRAMELAAGSNTLAELKTVL